MKDYAALFRQLRREVWIITAAAGQRRGGLTATWVSQASLDPNQPLLVVALAANHFTAELVAASGRFVAHLLPADQSSLAWHFAIGSGRDRDKLADIDHRVSDAGCPILINCLAWLECQVVDTHDTGDRHYYWAEVVAGEQPGAGEPLTNHRLFATATPEQRQADLANLQSDIAIQAPLAAAWRQRLKST